MTLKEIAKEANVSVSTVSRVINNKGNNVASREVQDRIWEIVRRTNYAPNRNAQRLRSKQSSSDLPLGNIECVFARMPFSDKDQFFSDLARSVEIEALSLNYVLRYSFTSASLQIGSASELSANPAKGVIILGRCDKATLTLLRRRFKNICFAGLNSFRADYDQVVCDGMEASRAAVNYLISLGHKTIGYIGETTEEIRYVGYRNALIENKLPTDRQNVANVLLSYKGGYNGAKKLLANAKGITAIFCANDITAIGAMGAIQECGLSIPGDISVIGVDDIELSQYNHPSLTTISIPIEEMGKISAKILVDRIQGGHRVPLKIQMPFQLKVRESCAKPSKG